MMNAIEVKIESTIEVVKLLPADRLISLGKEHAEFIPVLVELQRLRIALQQIATGHIKDAPDDHKNMIEIMREIAFASLGVEDKEKEELLATARGVAMSFDNMEVKH